MAGVPTEIQRMRKRIVREYVEARLAGRDSDYKEFAARAGLTPSGFLGAARRFRRKYALDYRDEQRAVIQARYERAIESTDSRDSCPMCGGVRDRQGYCTPCHNQRMRDYRKGRLIGRSPGRSKDARGHRMVDEFIDRRLAGNPTRKGVEYADSIGCSVSAFWRAVRIRKQERGITQDLKKGSLTSSGEQAPGTARKVYITDRLKRIVLTAVCEGDLLTREAAEELGVNVRTIARWIRKADLKVDDLRVNGGRGV